MGLCASNPGAVEEPNKNAPAPAPVNAEPLPPPVPVVVHPVKRDSASQVSPATPPPVPSTPSTAPAAAPAKNNSISLPPPSSPALPVSAASNNNVQTRPKGLSQDEISLKIVEENPSPFQLAHSLAQIPILANLTDAQRGELSAVLKERAFPDGSTIIKEGEIGQEFFLIKEGDAIVSKFKSDRKEEFQLAQLRKGDYFGEKALQSNEPRGATVRAKGRCTCLVLERDQFIKLFGATFNIQFAKRQAISAESGMHALAYVVPANAVREKSNAIREMTYKALKANVIFGHIDDEQHRRIVDEMWQRKVAAGETVIRQGEPGDNFYVVEKGEFEIFVEKNNKKPRKVAVISSGSSFGELALMYNAPRAATVTASADSILWAVDRFSFRKILANVSENKLKEYTTFLQGVPLLGPLAAYERAKIAEALEEVIFEPKATVVKQGDPGDTFFILRAGEVVITRHDEATPTVENEVGKCFPGDYFGERALLKGEPRAATITAVTRCVCLCLDRHAFTLLMGPLEEILHKRVASYSSGMNLANLALSPSASVESVSDGAPVPAEPQAKQKVIKMEKLGVIGTLGKGSFGHVQLVKDREDKETYALKTVSKVHVVEMGQQEHIASERQVMSMLDHPNIIRMYATFQDKKCIFFVMEPCLGGELFSVLRARSSFDVATARFYAASVVLAFEYMHSKDIVYRDLKPENLLLDGKGYLKITDFGFAKILKNDRTWTLCGTPDYLAPEVVSGQGHGKGVDWWTLGILIYEMLASYPPFYDDDPMHTYAKILQGAVSYPKHFSAEAKDLISGLLNPRPTKRLGVVKGGAKLIKEHPWFADFDWKGLRNRTVKAPIIPKIANDLDLSNFEKYPEDNTVFPNYIEDGNNYFNDF